MCVFQFVYNNCRERLGDKHACVLTWQLTQTQKVATYVLLFFRINVFILFSDRPNNQIIYLFVCYRNVSTISLPAGPVYICCPAITSHVESLYFFPSRKKYCANIDWHCYKVTIFLARTSGRVALVQCPSPEICFVNIATYSDSENTASPRSLHN